MLYAKAAFLFLTASCIEYCCSSLSSMLLPHTHLPCLSFWYHSWVATAALTKVDSMLTSAVARTRVVGPLLGPGSTQACRAPHAGSLGQ